MRYEVRIVENNRLPEGTDWASVRVPDGLFLFIKRSRFACPEALCEVLSAAWAARMACLSNAPLVAV